MVGQLTAGDEVNVLVTGPTGAGKTWLARLLARQAWGAEWLEEVDLRDCDASSLASRLAGTRRGEFTGAVDRQGAVARAISRGVPMLLDELHALDHSAQGALLSLLDLPRRLAGLSGTSQRLPGRLHVLGTTNHPVAHGAWEHRFRPDFWYRLVRGVHLDLPPLAARGPDVVHAWLTTFLNEACGRRPGDVLDAEALGVVLAAPWPGNLRELRGFAEALAALRRPRDPESRLILLDVGHLFEPPPIAGRLDPGASRWDAHPLLQRARGVLEQHCWNQAAAARQLGVDPGQLNRLLRRHGLCDEVRLRRAAGPLSAPGQSIVDN